MNPLANPGGIVGVPQPAYLVNTFSVYLILSGLVAAAFFVAGRPRITALGQAWLLAAVGCAAGLITLGYVAQAAYFGLAPRYAPGPGPRDVPGHGAPRASPLRDRGHLGDRRCPRSP